MLPPPPAVKTTSRIFFWQALYHPVLHCSHFWRITDNLGRMFLRAYRALLYTPFSVCESVRLASLDYLFCLRCLPNCSVQSSPFPTSCPTIIQKISTCLHLLNKQYVRYLYYLYCIALFSWYTSRTYQIMYKLSMHAFHSKFQEGLLQAKFKKELHEREKISASFDSAHRVEGLHWRKPTLFAVILFFWLNKPTKY